MKFVTNDGKPCSIPTIKNWIFTLENVQKLKKKLFDNYNIKSIWCRHFNQDPLENFFGNIRNHGLRNNSPTCAGFEAAFVSLLITTLSSYSPGSNCEEDGCFAFKLLKNIFFKQASTIEKRVELDFDDIINEGIIVSLDEKKKIHAL